METFETFEIGKGKLELQIVNQFKKENKDKYIKDGCHPFECKFSIEENPRKYDFSVEYYPEAKYPYDSKDVKCYRDMGTGVSDHKVKLKIMPYSSSPGVKTLSSQLRKILEDAIDEYEIDQDPPLNIKDDYAAHM